METVLQWAVSNGNTKILLAVLAYMAARDCGPFLWRKIQGRNGNASLRGQLDGMEKSLKRVERTTNESHDLLINHDVRLDRAEKDIVTLFDLSEKRHAG